MKVLAVIPARGGSKGVPGKNIRPVAGKPLIAWTIAAARDSKRIERVVVSTDAPAIRDVAIEHGAEAPFLRPAELAADTTPGMPPILHATRWLEEHEGYRPDVVACLQPTSPLRSADDLAGALALLERSGANSVVSVVESAHHPYWTKSLDEAGRVRPFDPSAPIVPRRQDLPPAYALNGAIYAAKRDLLLRTESWYDDTTVGYVMPPERSIDIDTPLDLKIADILLGELHARND